jgi:hypothetical protein
MKQKTESSNVLEIGNLVSVPFGSSYLQGTVKSIDDNHLTIENYASGIVKVPNNDLVYKFFPGQKFDIRELNVIDENSKDKLSVKDKLNVFLGKTQYKSFDNLLKNHPKQVGQLLAGKMTSEVYNGASLIQKSGENFKTMVNWSAKFQLVRGKDRNLKLQNQFKSQKFNLKEQVYGKPLSKDEIEATVKQGKTVTIDRVSNEGKPFKRFAKFDKDLNRIVTTPYSKKIAERITNSQAKSSKQTQTKSKTITKKPAAKKQTGKTI